MQVKDRTENPLLNRTELKFSIKHERTATPSRGEMLHLVSRAEPGSKLDLIIIKNVQTRFGQPLTTGTALIYADEDSMRRIEMEYMLARHASVGDAPPKPAAKKPAAKKPAAPAAEPPVAAPPAEKDVSGGEE